MKDIFGKNVQELKREVCMYAFHDERKVNEWLYHGFLFIPVEHFETTYNFLMGIRNNNNWQKPVHFKDLNKTRDMNNTARQWVEGLDQHGDLYRKIYYHFFGVDLNRIEKRLWKKDKNWKIYNRFFQIGLYSGLKWFFSDSNPITIKRIYSDKKSRTYIDTFHTKLIFEIEVKSLLKNENIIFEINKIFEVDSDHRKERNFKEESHVIQFVDVIIGGISQVIDFTSLHIGKNLIAETLVNMRLPERVMSYNINSRFYKLYSVSFFPKHKISLDEFNKETLEIQVRKKDQFYTKRPMKFVDRDQMSLFGESQCMKYLP